MAAEQRANVMGAVYGQVLKRRRKDREISICELSDRPGIRQKLIAGVELGLLKLSETQKRRIGKFLRRQRII